MCLRIGELVGNRVGDPLREERRPIELQQPLLDHTPHQVGDIDLVHPVAEAPLEAVAVEQREEELEIFLLPVVWRGGHEQQVAGERAEQPCELVAFRILDLTTEEGCRELVGLIADDEIPTAINSLELLLYRLIAGQFVEPRDHQVVLKEPVAGAGRLQCIVGEDREGQVEAAVELILPLLGQATRADDEAALEITASDELLDQQASHNRLASTGVIGQQEAQRLTGEHGLVDSGDLVGQWFDKGGMDGQYRIEEMGEADAMGLSDQAKEGAVAIEAPGAARIGDCQRRLIVAVEQTGGGAPGGILVSQF